MEQTNNNAESLYGRVVKEARPCDKCKFEKNDCRKVEVNGVGMLCLVKDKHTDWLKKYNALNEKFEEATAKNEDNRNIIAKQYQREKEQLYKIKTMENELNERQNEHKETFCKLNDLQKRFDEQFESSLKLVKECQAWHKKFNNVEKRLKDQLKADEYLSEQVEELKSKNSTLEMSNKGMEDELNRLREQRDELSKKCSEALADNKRLHNQSLWEKIFNR